MSCAKKIRPEWIPSAYANPDDLDKHGNEVIKLENLKQVAQIVRSHKKKIR